MRWKSALTVATKRQTRRVSLTLLPDGRPLTFLFSVDFQPVKIVLIYFISLHCQPRNIDYQWLFFTGLIRGSCGRDCPCIPTMLPNRILETSRKGKLFNPYPFYLHHHPSQPALAQLSKTPLCQSRPHQATPAQSPSYLTKPSYVPYRNYAPQNGTVVN